MSSKGRRKEEAKKLANARSTYRREQSANLQTNWLNAYQGAGYANENYRTFLERLKNGQIRNVKRGKKRFTTMGWIDEFMLSLEEKSDLVQS